MSTRWSFSVVVVGNHGEDQTCTEGGDRSRPQCSSVGLWLTTGVAYRRGEMDGREAAARPMLAPSESMDGLAGGDLSSG